MLAPKFRPDSALTGVRSQDGAARRRRYLGGCSPFGERGLSDGRAGTCGRGAARNQPTSGWALQEVKGWPVAGRVMATTCPGARLTGVVGPNSVPFERWTSTLTRFSAASVVFSTVPMKALASESYDSTSRAPARTWSKVSSSPYWVADSSPSPRSPDSDSSPPLCSPASEPLPCSSDSESVLSPNPPKEGRRVSVLRHQEGAPAHLG